MPGKDPAALFYIDHWLVATQEMKAECRGWYLNLVLHQFKAGDLPSDLEELANLASVRISEFTLFQQVWQQVLKQKFEMLPTGRIQDIEAAQIIRAREDFKEKRSAAGQMSAFTKFIRRELCTDENVISFVRKHVNPEHIITNDQQVLKQVFDHLFQLYINRNKNKEIEDDIGGTGEKEGEREGYSGSGPPVGPPWPEHASGLPQAMVETFVKIFPGYLREDAKDFSACLQIAYRIAEQNGWEWQSALNGHMDQVLEKWNEIVCWVKADKWFRTKSISFLNNNFQDLIQAKSNGTANQQTFRTSKTSGNGFDPTVIASTGFGKL